MRSPRTHVNVLRHLARAFAPGVSRGAGEGAAVRIRASRAVATSATAVETAGACTEPVLDTKEFRPFPLVDRWSITHNTHVFRFGLPSQEAVLGLPIGQHISLCFTNASGKKVMRSYTPVSCDEEDYGYFDLVIKVYPQGQMSSHVDSLDIGDSILVRGPKGRFKYKANMAGHLAMICGGTGIAPMLQVLKAVLRDPSDVTPMTLIFANVNPEDILFQDELDALAADPANRLSVHYVLNNPPEGWTGSEGFVTADIMRAQLPAPAEDVQLLFCGPPPMVKALKGASADLGYTNVFAF